MDIAEHYRGQLALLERLDESNVAELMRGPELTCAGCGAVLPESAVGYDLVEGNIVTSWTCPRRKCHRFHRSELSIEQLRVFFQACLQRVLSTEN